jgi:hypothetical protein
MNKMQRLELNSTCEPGSVPVTPSVLADDMRRTGTHRTRVVPRQLV